MERIRTRIRRALPQLLLIWAALGFMLLLAELLLTNHTGGERFLAPSASLVGLFLSLWGLLRTSPKLVVALGLLLVAGVGLIGMAEHWEGDEGGEVYERETEATPPPLAPLSLSGVAALALMGLVAKEENQQDAHTLAGG